MTNSSFDALIIGGGPAGCSCALWLKHLGLKPLIIEKSDRLGGLQNESPYPNIWILGQSYRNGRAFAASVEKQIKVEKIATQFRAQVESLSFSQANQKFVANLSGFKKSKTLEASFIVLATGVKPRTGGFTPSPEVLIGPGDHIETASYRGKRVAILGGGDNAFENYQFIKKKKPKSIKIFARNVRAQFSFVKKVKSGDLRVGQYDVDIDGKKVNGEVFDSIVVMYGWQGVNALEGIVSLNMRNGFVETDYLRRTSHENIYAIGEVSQSAHPCCVTAMADGIIAAKDIQTRIDQVRVAQQLKLK
jgi:thioredoxin reductase (NADPH)